MNSKLKEINEIIGWCDRMSDVVHKIGYIKTDNQYYCTYRKQIQNFFNAYGDLADKNYAPYAILYKYWTDSPKAVLYPSEIEAIGYNLILIKQYLFKDAYEKIFISHREDDKEQVAAFIELLHAVGIPRVTIDASESVIFCTSHPEGYIKNGERNLDKIRDMINTDEHVFYILWYTDKYFESLACLNEAGAIWAMKKKYQEILVPGFDNNKIRGMLDKQPVWFRADDKLRLNTFKAQLEAMFGLTPITPNVWEIARDKFISQISKATSTEEGFCEQ